jgi:phosphoglucosamine mutase
LKRNTLIGGVLGTLMSNLGLEIALAKLKIPFFRTKVGDRYVLEGLQEKNWRIGAENSGHVILLDKSTTGDGIIASLQIVSAMVRNQKSLHDLCLGVRLLPQKIINVKCTKGSRPLENHKVKSFILQAEKKLYGNGRVLLRESGTEPLVRVMVEGEDKRQINLLAKETAHLVEEASTMPI